MIWYALALVLPTLAGLGAGWLFWRRRQVTVGNAVGSLVLFLGILFCMGCQYVTLQRQMAQCVSDLTACPSDASMPFLIYACIGFVDVATIFWRSLIFEERNREKFSDWS